MPGSLHSQPGSTPCTSWSASAGTCACTPPPGTAVRGSGSVRRCGKNGHAVVRVGLLRRSGAGSCPNLLQRRSGSGSAARGSAEYQRFSSGAPVRWGPLQQIWTNGSAAGPGRGAPGRTATAAGAPIGRAGPRECPPRSPSDPRRRPARPLWAPSAPRRALRTRKCSSNRHSRVQNAHFECKMHISARKRADPLPPTPDGYRPHRSAPPPARGP